MCRTSGWMPTEKRVVARLNVVQVCHAFAAAAGILTSHVYMYTNKRPYHTRVRTEMWWACLFLLAKMVCHSVRYKYVRTSNVCILYNIIHTNTSSRFHSLYFVFVVFNFFVVHFKIVVSFFFIIIYLQWIVVERWWKIHFVGSVFRWAVRSIRKVTKKRKQNRQK